LQGGRKTEAHGPSVRDGLGRFQNLNCPNLLGLDCQIQAITAGFGNPARAGWDGYFSRIALPETSEAMLYATMTHLMVRRLARKSAASS